MRLFQHKLNGKIYRLVEKRKSDVNTYIEVDKDNNPVVDWRSWNVMPQEQKAIIRGFKNLTEIK
jgi:hypothetical protein